MKTIKLFPVLLLLTGTIILAACKKGDKQDPSRLIKMEATVYNSGAVAADGCDWTINVGGVSYHPDNLSDELKINAQKVIIDAQIMDQQFSCGWGAKLAYLHLNSIVKQ